MFEYLIFCKKFISNLYAFYLFRFKFFLKFNLHGSIIVENNLLTCKINVTKNGKTSQVGLF